MNKEAIYKNNVEHGRRLYKQMSLEVAVRNPERYSLLLKIFEKNEGAILNDDGILDIFSQLYIDGFLTDQNINVSKMDKSKIEDYIRKNKTHNNEWGFPTGFQAAFTRYLKTLSEFGFIYAQYNQPLMISPIGKAMALGFIEPSEAFAIQSMRFWRKSPYRRVLNDFNYFKFIYDVLIRLSEKSKSLSYVQFMISLFSDDGNVENFLNTIESVKFGTDFDKAYSFVLKNYSEIDKNHSKVAKQNTAFRDYGNTVFRVLQLTGFITVKYSGTILLSINKNRLDFLRELYSMNFELSDAAKEDEYKYFEEIGSYPTKLKNLVLKYREKEDYSTTDYNKKIPNIIKSYNLTRQYLSDYLMDISQNKSDPKVFWFIQAPVKFEFLLTLYIYSYYGDEYEYKPNFKCDDNGIPYSHAPGNIGDIEIFNSTFYWLLEATLIQNKTQQLNNETLNIVRHIDSSKAREKYLELVAPYIHDDTKLMLRTANLISMIEKKDVKFYSKATPTKEFIQITKEKNNLQSIKDYSNITFDKIKKLLDEFLDDKSNH